MSATTGEIGGAITDPERLTAWREKFRYYRQPPDEGALAAWLSNFAADDVEAAAKVLDSVTVVGEPDIQIGYRLALEALPGWDRNPNERVGKWFFVGFGKPSESGPAMLRVFREANNLAASHYDGLFVSVVDLPGLKLTAADNIVFVDDFSGSGQQVVNRWPIVAEMVASEASCYLVLTALTQMAKDVIEADTNLVVKFQYELGHESCLFHPSNTTFSEQEKDVIEKYCAIAEPRDPRGVGGMGVLFVLHHKSANNCLPILYVNEARWRGIFPRYLKPDFVM